MKETQLTLPPLILYQIADNVSFTGDHGVLYANTKHLHCAVKYGLFTWLAATVTHRQIDRQAEVLFSSGVALSQHEVGDGDVCEASSGHVGKLPLRLAAIMIQFHFVEVKPLRYD